MITWFGCSKSDASTIRLRVCRFNAGSSVTQRNDARASDSAARSDEPCKTASITAVAMTVFPEPVTAERANDESVS